MHDDRDPNGLASFPVRSIPLKRHTGSPDKEAFIHLALEADRKIKRKEKELAQKYLG